ncbi:MAG: hypothetical protein MJZ84_07495 [Paludibacteraceae bacterium]|nr:hypothetical protein [Paludibacteraceae bacterium]
MDFTKEQISKWKAEYGQLYKITVKDDANGNKSCVLKQPSRQILGAASQAGKDNPIKFNEVILNNCWLGGDEEIKTNDMLFISASQKIGDIIEIKEAELEKL